MNNKYIYTLTIIPLFEDVSNTFIINNSIYGKIFDTIEEAIEEGKNQLYSIGEEYLLGIEDINEEDINGIYDSSYYKYIFKIIKYKVYHLSFKDTDELLKYYNNKFPIIVDKEYNYDFMMSLIGYEEFYYNYKGELVSTKINQQFDDCLLRFTSKSFMNEFTVCEFKDGDFVIRKNYNDKTAYRIKKVIGNNDLTSYTGYELYDPIRNICINDLPEPLYFDQDLIKVDVCPRCYTAITDNFKDEYYSIGNRCPRCLSEIKELMN